MPCVFLANRFDRLAGGHQALLAPANHVSATSEGATARDGLFVAPDNYTTVHRKLILDLAARYQLSAIYAFRYFVADGGLVSYGVDPIDPFREAAGYVDRILRGEKPADLPVQQPTKFELLIDPDGRHDWHHSF